ncbi:hypothetical protein DKX38_028188 [Salix brachista]|uniref:Kinesin motor domain-containing protein n=1 Tax=Salix brachista TaxID=2182728 RepID=A0A5N5J645_9ROSI|nr:hypothetical protein DKX38_028188 [Salix brachista]
MNVVGRRQMPRSNSTTAHHHRQYSDNFLDSSRWLLQSSSQDFGNRSRSSSLRKIGDDQFSPGLFDLHSFDTDLLPELKPLNQAAAANRGENNNLSKSMSLDKERLNNNNNVAKIKVVVRKRPLNKKEMSRKEEDIITIESNSNSNSLTVHETKLKVDLTEYVEKHEFVFDAVLKEGVSNDEVYSQTVQPIVPLIFQRTKATCFAYGQTGKQSGFI